MDQLLWKEYELAYQIYEGYNGQLLTLKSWSVTIGIAALIGAYTKPISSSGRIGVLLAALSAIPFWLTETFWKLFQRTSLDRLLEIEACQTGASIREGACVVAQISTVWNDSFAASSWKYWLEGAFDLHVLLPHLALLVIGLLLAAFRPPIPSSTDD
ncbi:hypothetical protein JANAI62_10100 [Jannaschia pagri]|uniref:Uncharacterized protein n=1 Tax=Jannaschia pagri TaxID=2829797 RepID=A0ABQ4NJ00_9RHOB|nr:MULTISPECIES: hypothetical protein [unclassified Jannaschia]GIT90555.1 hypothetical protein JANAI61_10130 [Jannaschia sp. AI_61]GIT94387.1 hypothetical protein JANAI62_10100 [Jannaschia sp. AI_62]